jgi:hypothetical protein
MSSNLLDDRRQQARSSTEEVECWSDLPESWRKYAAPSRHFEGESDTVRRE